MLRHRFLFLALSLCLSMAAAAQLGKIPVAVTAAFAKQYTAAQKVSYEDKLSEFRVHFIADDTPMIARYSSKGVWKGSERPIAFDQLSAEVKDGFSKSKYAGWKVQEVALLYLPERDGGGEQYRLKVGKGDLQKKYLYFNKVGRLVRDIITL